MGRDPTRCDWQVTNVLIIVSLFINARAPGAGPKWDQRPPVRKNEAELVTAAVTFCDVFFSFRSHLT